MASVRGSSCRATTVWAILSATVGIPNILVPPPCGFGISTARTGGGKYVPEDIRFQILYRLFFRSASKSSMDCPSTPAAPFFALTRLYASQTSPFEISNDLTFGSDLLTRSPPGTTPGCSRKQTTDEPAPSLPSHYRSFSTTTSRSASVSASVLNASQFLLLDALPLATRHLPRPQVAVSAHAFPRSM